MTLFLLLFAVLVGGVIDICLEQVVPSVPSQTLIDARVSSTGVMCVFGFRFVRI